MDAGTLLNELRADGAQVDATEDGHIEVAGTLTDEQREAIRASKPVLLKLLGCERRRQQLHQMMAEGDQAKKYYWVTDTKSNPRFVILALGIRGVGTGELKIPRAKYDPFLLMKALEQTNEAGTREH